MVGIAGALLATAGWADAQSGPRIAKPMYERTVLGDRPAAYWRLGERSAKEKADDESPHNRDGVYRGKPSLGQPGAIALDKGTALGLRGSTYVQAPASKAFSVATSGRGLTVEAWLRPDALHFAGEGKKDYIHWLGKGEGNAMEWGFRFYNSKSSDRPNRISAYIWNPTGGEGAGAYFQDKLTPGKWIHIVATFDDPRQPNARVRIYRNGVASPNNGSPGTLYKSYKINPKSGSAPVRLGTRDLGSFLTGGLDDVAIYPYVLTPEQIMHHWRVGSGKYR